MAETRRYKLLVEFDGTGFSGWQFQTNARSVQGELESALHSLLRQEIRIHGAGRTDAGVHASGMTAHFDAVSDMNLNEMCKGINALLPKDIAILRIEQAEPSFHSRFTASSRSYTYAISHRKRAMNRQYVWVLYSRLDTDKIQECIPHVLGTHDFSGFSKRNEKLDHTYCHVFHVEWISEEGEHRFNIKANRFLYGMVRCLVGGLVLVGRGKMTTEQFLDILELKSEENNAILAPAQGLTLTHVAYDLAERRLIDEIKNSLQVQLIEEQVRD